jgi:hypothetical protein
MVHPQRQFVFEKKNVISRRIVILEWTDEGRAVRGKKGKSSSYETQHEGVKGHRDHTHCGATGGTRTSIPEFCQSAWQQIVKAERPQQHAQVRTSYFGRHVRVGTRIRAAACHCLQEAQCFRTALIEEDFQLSLRRARGRTDARTCVCACVCTRIISARTLETICVSALSS